MGWFIGAPSKSAAAVRSREQVRRRSTSAIARQESDQLAGTYQEVSTSEACMVGRDGLPSADPHTAHRTHGADKLNFIWARSIAAPAALSFLLRSPPAGGGCQLPATSYIHADN